MCIYILLYFDIFWIYIYKQSTATTPRSPTRSGASKAEAAREEETAAEAVTEPAMEPDLWKPWVKQPTNQPNQPTQPTNPTNQPTKQTSSKVQQNTPWKLQEESGPPPKKKKMMNKTHWRSANVVTLSLQTYTSFHWFHISVRNHEPDAPWQEPCIRCIQCAGVWSFTSKSPHLSITHHLCQQGFLLDGFFRGAKTHPPKNHENKWLEVQRKWLGVELVS